MTTRLMRIALVALVSINMSGCVALPMAAMAISGFSMYNKLNPEKNVNIELSEVNAERMRKQLRNVNHLAILGSSTATVAFSDVWERSGKQASIVSSQGDPTAMSMSQAKGLLVAACKQGIQASAYGKLGRQEMSHLGLLIGKASTNAEADLYIYNCKNKKLESAPFTIAFNAMGQDGNEVDRSIGAGLASKLLDIGQ